MTLLRVIVPIGENDEQRTHIQVRISSVEEWNTNLRVKAQPRKPLRESKPTVLTGDSDGRIRRLTLVEKEAQRKAAVAGRNALPPRRKSLLHLPVSQIDQPSDEQIAKNRETALQILEGTLQPAPNRNYTGDFAPVFRKIAYDEQVDMEKRQAEHARNHARSVLKQALHGPAPIYEHRGWKFIRALILGELDEEQAQSFPAYAEAQRAFLLMVEQINGQERVVYFRNLDACPMLELIGLMKIDERGWRDVVWVTSTRERPPRTLTMTDEGVQELEWGIADGVREIRV